VTGWGRELADIGESERDFESGERLGGGEADELSFMGDKAVGVRPKRGLSGKGSRATFITAPKAEHGQ